MRVKHAYGKHRLTIDSAVSVCGRDTTLHMLSELLMLRRQNKGYVVSQAAIHCVSPGTVTTLLDGIHCEDDGQLCREQTVAELR